MAWYVSQANGTFEKAATSPGSKWVEVVGSTDSMTEAQAKQQLVNGIADGDYGESVLNGLEHLPGISNAVNAAHTIESDASKAASDTESGVDAIGSFFDGLTEANLWIRVAKVALGGIILLVGIAKLTGIEKGVVGTAVKAAPLL
jgi:hypothetical protein